ncbi:MAG: DUF448 domain-containing protein [Sphingomonadaceae bacterium]
MRTPVHEVPGQDDGLGGKAHAGHVPERRCILSGAHGARARLIRLVEGPDGQVWPDLGARLPGRGAWIAADRPLLEEALRRGRLRGALARAFRTAPPTISDDLPERIAHGLESRALDRLGLEHRAGKILFGSERLLAAARAGKLQLLLHAGDAAADGVAKLEQALRAWGPADSRSIRLPVGRERLSRALGRDNMVHVGISDGRAAARVAKDLARWIAYMRPSDEKTPAQGRDSARGEDEGLE